MDVKMSLKRQKNGTARVEYRLVGPFTAPEKGRILGRIWFEDSSVDYRFVGFRVNSVVYSDLIEDMLFDEEEDIYLTSKKADCPEKDYLFRMTELFCNIGYAINKNLPSQKKSSL